ASKAAAAEPVEPRAGAKRNAHRTQGRANVTPALDRVRQAARQRKKEKKFTALDHHPSIDLLQASFLALKPDAAPGVDDMTWKICRRSP
ncbi:MAG TPA: group II intron reverse transcriptase/maturase, partial [Steroidobacteraceae bacterium]|nr:group II intron reverse transcriptase/maturase [Steroidobacteraceae bacterium]